MATRVGTIRELFRYPVKSMAALALESSGLGWHGMDGDRRFAIRRRGELGSFPWLTASRFPELLRYRPVGHETVLEEPLPTHAETPEGERLELLGEALRADISRRCGDEVDMVKVDHGVFDEASVSVISHATLLGIERELERPLDRRSFRPNIVIDTADPAPFIEDRWVGRSLIFGEGETAAAVGITMRDARCVMINLDPETANSDPAIMRAVLRMNGNHAGVYGTVLRRGDLVVGQRVGFAEPA